MSSISERESREIEAANASGTTPVVFIHGLWLLPSSWANWADFFKRAGYAAADAGLARRSRNGRGRAGEPGRPRQEDTEAGGRPHDRRDRQPGGAAPR